MKSDLESLIRSIAAVFALYFPALMFSLPDTGIFINPDKFILGTMFLLLSLALACDIDEIATIATGFGMIIFCLISIATTANASLIYIGQIYLLLAGCLLYVLKVRIKK